MAKPFGMITKYYPFIDEESRTILDTLIEESENYYEFTQRLGEVVLNNDVSINLAYLAAVHTWWCRAEDTMSQIQEKYRYLPCIRPWGYPHANMILLLKLHDPLVEAIEEARKTTIEDWMETELHLLHSYFHYPYHGDVPSLLKPVESAKRLIDANPNLKCFEPLIYALEGYAMRNEGDTEEAITKFKKGLELAGSYDDALYKYIILVNYGAASYGLHIQSALQLYEELYQLAQDLGVPYLLSEVLNDSGIVYEIAGEYDLAISCHREVIGLIGENFWTSTILSRIYAFLGQEQRALDEINQYIERTGTPEFPSWGLARARSLALLNRVEEAERDLESIQAQLMRIGSEAHLTIFDHVSGMIEMARGNYSTATDILEKCMDASEVISHSERNYILLNLAKSELILAQEHPNTSGMATPGKWLSKLERYAWDRDLPGIKMQAALLKSEFYQQNGQLKDALVTLMDSLSITDSPGVATLRKRINSRIQEIDGLIKDGRPDSPIV